MTTARALPLGLLCAALTAACNGRDPVQVDGAAPSAAPSAARTAAPAPGTPGAAHGRKPMILNLLGTGTAEMRTLVINGVPTPNQCFTVGLVDVETQRVVGKGTDCIAAKPDEQYPAGLEVVGTTIFDFGNGHTFTSRGLTTVQPTTHGSPEITHITGAIPPAGENGIVAATGRYERLRARVRLSGAVNMSRMAQGQVYFDCLFAVHPL